MMRRLFPLCALVLAVGCGGRDAPVLFDDGAVVRIVRDDAPIPYPPEREFHRISFLMGNYSIDQTVEMLHLESHGPARDVNRLGEVPASSWYAGAGGRQSPEAVRLGPGHGDPGPEPHRPWTVTGMKVGGLNPGFVFRDARGVSYICKFDKPGVPVVSTAAGAVALRLAWALGYHTPDDRVVEFARTDLRMDPEATVKNSVGEKRPLLAEDIDGMLEAIPAARSGDGYRALVSRYLDGRPRGGYAFRGVNPHDPNDRIPHQDRRSLRAIRVFGAWLNHIDCKEDNSLDVYVGAKGAGHLVHHLVDFDGYLGGFWAARPELRVGHARDFDLEEFVTGIPALGLDVRPYEDTPPPAHPHVGRFSEFAFDPAAWKPNYVNDQLVACGPADAFWAGTVLAGIDDATIAAAVEFGRFPDSAAATELTRVLIARRDLTLRWALTRVSPAVELEPVTETGGFRVDAASAPAMAGLAIPLSWRAEVLSSDGSTLATPDCSPALAVPTELVSAHDYVIVRWIARDDEGRDLPPTEAHYGLRGGGWALRGIVRAGA